MDLNPGLCLPMPLFQPLRAQKLPDPGIHFPKAIRDKEAQSSQKWFCNLSLLSGSGSSSSSHILYMLFNFIRFYVTVCVKQTVTTENGLHRSP